MARDDKSDTAGAGRPGVAGMGPKRPTPTIELEAQEVEIHPSEGTEGPSERGADTEAAADPAPDAAIGGDDGEAQTVGAASGSGPDAGAPGSGDPRPPHANTEPRELRRFLTHLAAGLAGGVIGVLAAGYGLGHLPLGALIPDAAQDPRIEQLTARVAALDARLTESAAMARQAPQALERIEGLEQTLAALEDAALTGEGVADAAAITAAIARLRQRLDRDIDGLRQALGDAGSQGEAAREELRARLDSLGQDLAGLRQEMDARAAEPVVDSQAAARLDALSTRVAALAQDLEQAGEPVAFEQARTAALALAFADLRRAADAGDSFSGELAAVEALAPPDADLTVLKAHAESGVPTRRTLVRALPDIAREATTAPDEAPQAARSLTDRLLSGARSVVTVRRTATPDGTAVADVVARMQARAEAGDLAGAVAEGESLSGRARAALEPWLADARARDRIDASLATLERRTLSMLGTAPREGRQR